MKGHICINTRAALLVLGAGAAAFIALQAPDAKRYMKFESM